MTCKELKLAALCGAVCAATLSGCVGSIESLFNDQFLTQVGATREAANIPGVAPAIVVNLENRTTRTVVAEISYRLETDTIEAATLVVQPGITTGRALVCPVLETTIGDLSSPDMPGVRVILGAGGPDDAFVEVEPFGVVLTEGVNYDCGDSITFAVMPSSSSRSGYTIVAFIQPSESP
jgi:hypothetical protein